MPVLLRFPRWRGAEVAVVYIGTVHTLHSDRVQYLRVLWMPP